MKKCLDCGKEFIETKTLVVDMTPGTTDIEDSFCYKYDVCPFCESTNYIELDLCECCGEWVDGLTDTEGMMNGSIGMVCDQCLENNDIRVLITFTSSGSDIGYLEMIPVKHDPKSDQITFEAEFFTDDYVTTTNRFRTVHKCPHCGKIILNSANANVKDRLYFSDRCSNFFNEGIMNITESDSLLIPIQDAELTITVLHRDSSNELLPTDNEFAKYDKTYRNYIWTNIYNTASDPVTFIKPMNTIRSNIEYKDYYNTGVSAFDCLIYDMPFIKYSILAYRDTGMVVTDPLIEDDIGKFYDFIDSYLNNYLVLENARLTLRNATNIDVKFYNTYGKSTNFTIGEGKEYIATNNIKIKFSVWLTSGTDSLMAGPESK